jgi:hypothetical protein
MHAASSQSRTVQLYPVPLVAALNWQVADITLFLAENRLP